MKIAVVGCGQIADAHVMEALKIPQVNIVGVCDQNWHMADQLAVRFSLRPFTDLDVMLSETQPDVVHVTTPPLSHYAIAKKVLNYGCHLYLEKPFTAYLWEAIELGELARKKQRLLCVGHNQAFAPGFLRLQSLYEGGELGEIVHVDGFMGYNLAGPFGSVIMGDPTHWVHQLPGGLAQNNISHPLSLILPFLTDEEPQVRSVRLRKRLPLFGDARDDLFDELRATIVGASCTANLTFSCHACPVHTYVVVHGTKAQALFHGESRTLRLVRGATLPGPFGRMQWARNDKKEAQREYRQQVGGFLRAELFFFDGMNTLFRQFYGAIAGKNAEPIPVSEAIRATRIMEKLFESCEPMITTDRRGATVCY
jgi:predicted dehydrogenase